jgi:hypothetical protein
MSLCNYNCGRETLPGSKLDACHVCRANINFWERRRPAEVLARREKLNLYTTRMKDVEGGRRKKK